jgi:hypothetical protein
MLATAALVLVLVVSVCDGVEFGSGKCRVGVPIYAAGFEMAIALSAGGQAGSLFQQWAG